MTQASVFTLESFLEALSATRGLAATGQLIARGMLDFCGASSVRVLLLSDHALETVAVANAPGVSSLVGNGFRFEDLPLEGVYREVISGTKARSTVRLEARGRVVGVLECSSDCVFSASESVLFAAGLAFDAARLARDGVRRERETRSLAELSKRVSNTLELREILDFTLSFVVEALALERGMIGLFSKISDEGAEASGYFKLNFPELESDEVLSISSESFARLVRGQPIVLNDVQTSSRSFAKTPKEFGAEAFLMLPLVAHNETLGVLYADSKRSGLEITERMVSLGQAMLEIAALAVLNARLFAQESSKRRDAEDLREVMQRLSASLSVSETLEIILQTALRLLGANACAVFERVRGIFEPRASLNIDEVSSLVGPRDLDALGLALQIESAALLDDVIAVPLFARGEVYGGLILYFDQPRSLQTEELRTLEAFAAQAGVALGNARAFADENALLEIARLTSSTLELEEVLARVSKEAVETLDLQRCFIGFFDVFDPLDRRAEIGRLYAHGFEDGLEGFIKPFVIADEAYVRLLEDLEPIVINEAQDESLENEGPTLLGAQAFVIAPIQVQGEVLGVLYADSTRSSEITGRETRLAVAMAQQAALAIQNARLYERLQAQEARYRLLAEGASDLIISTDLEGTITYANDAAIKVLGFDAAKLLDKRFDELLVSDSAITAREVWRAMRERMDTSKTLTAKALRADGSIATLEVGISALYRDGVLQGGLAIARDLSEQQKLAVEIAQRGQAQARASELRSFLSLFTQAQEEERRRIARELHDDTAQTLVAITRRLDRFENAFDKMAPDDARARVRDIRGDVDAAIDSVRRFSRNLRPSALDDLGLLPALEWLCEQSSVPARLEVQGEERRLDSDVELTVYRVVQEALTNIDKHAEASSCAVRVRYDENVFNVSVSDDGRGLIQSGDHLVLEGHLGLAGMRERVALAGGEMQVSSAEGEGVRLEFRFRL